MEEAWQSRLNTALVPQSSDPPLLGARHGIMGDEDVLYAQSSLEDVDLPLPPGSPEHTRAAPLAPPRRPAISLNDILKNDEELEHFKVGHVKV